MQRCTDCGLSNRPGVRFCTHCGRPTTASGAVSAGPTSIVAAVVLAIGLLAFLTIQPRTSPQVPALDPLVAAAPLQVDVAPDGSDAPLSEPQAARPETTAAEVQGGKGAEPDAATDPPPERGAPASLENASPDPDADPSPAEAVRDATPIMTSAADPSRWPTASASPESPPASTTASPSPPTAFAGTLDLDASLAQLRAAPHDSDLITPAASSSPLLLREAPALSHASRSLGETRASGASGHRPAASHPAAPAAATAKRAAVDPAPPARRSVASRSPSEGSWLRRLRAEIDACKGNLIVRTVCEETAKLRYCASAKAWGEVPECPAARLPDLATFN